MPICSVADGMFFAFGVLSFMITGLALLGAWYGGGSGRVVTLTFALGMVGFFIGLVMFPYVVAYLGGCSAVLR